MSEEWNLGVDRPPTIARLTDQALIAEHHATIVRLRDELLRVHRDHIQLYDEWIRISGALLERNAWLEGQLDESRRLGTQLKADAAAALTRTIDRT